MLRGRRALVSLYLGLVCLLSLTLQPAAQPCSQDILKTVTYLISEAPKMKGLNSSLYTPTFEDFQNCPNSTLKCFADEMKVLIEEWGSDLQIRRSRLNIKLERLASSFNQTESDCRRCELLEEKNAEDFLERLRGTLEMMNSQYCRSTKHAPPKAFQKRLDPSSSS